METDTKTKVLKAFEEEYPADLSIKEAAVNAGVRSGTPSTYIKVDNYATHKTPAIQRWLARRPRYHLHFTPTSSSWLNQVERWFAALTEKQLRRGVFRSTRELEQAIEQYIDQHNAASKPFIWTKTADQLLATIARFCHRIHNSGH